MPVFQLDVMEVLQHVAEVEMVVALVPEADKLTWEEALKLAKERDKELAMTFVMNVQ